MTSIVAETDDTPKLKTGGRGIMEFSNQLDSLAYYENLLKAQKCEAFKVQQSTDRGKCVVATTEVKKGEIIYHENPIVSLQTLENKQDVAVCHCCKIHLGTVEQQMELLSKRVARPEYHLHKPGWQFCKPEHCEISAKPSTNKTEIGISANLHASVNMLPCKFRCGELYCSKRCLQVDLEKNGHIFQCTGPIDDTNHPLFQFKLHAIETNEIFLLAYQVCCQIIQAYKSQLIDEHKGNLSKRILAAKNSYKRFHANPWWDIVWPQDSSDQYERQILASTVRTLAAESFQLMKQAVLAVEKEQNESTSKYFSSFSCRL